MKRYLVWAAVFLCLSCNSQQITVIKVHDGDTFYTSDHRSIRINGIDAPELGQDYGYEVKNYLEIFILNKQVTIYDKGKDKYGRTIADVYIRGTSIADLLVSNGWAWVYEKYGSRYLLDLQSIARKNHRGIWLKNNNIPPFKYRQNEKDSKQFYNN